MFQPKISKDLFFRDFKDKTFVLTGYTSGIGEGVFNYLSLLNCNLILIGRKKKNNHKFYKCDLTSQRDLEKITKRISKQNKEIHGFVHCAGINEVKNISNVTLKDWNKVLSVNLTSAFIVSKILKENFKISRNSSIVYVSSIAGHRKSLVSGVHYVSSKSGLIGLAKQLSHEFGKYNIRVNCIAPSQTATKMLSKSMTKKQISKLLSSIPLKRLATVQDQSLVILFLLSSLSSYITGTSINVDGGQI